MAGLSGFISTGQALFDTNAPGLSLLLVQILIILLTCRLVAIPFAYIRQPRVIAEVIAGILLGPTALGRWTWFRTTFFQKSSMGPLSLLANLGLIFFLLLMGLELDLSIVKQRARVSVIISLAGIIVPFALSVGVSEFFFRYLPGISELPNISYVNFVLFIGVAMSITALPVLARILTERKLLQTPVGVIVISAAAVDDAISWAFLALVVALLGASNPLAALYIFLVALAFTGFMLFLVSPALLILYRRLQVYDRAAEANVPALSQSMVVASFVITMIASFFTSAIGIHTIFGGFITGLALPRENGFAVALTHRLEDFVTLILLPLYFAYSGLRTDIGAISDGLSWGAFFLAFSCAVLGKIGGCTLAARATGSSWREAFTIGCMMNTKGLVEIIVLNLGLDAGIITQQVFAIMVLLAIVTTVMTTPIITVLYPPSCYTKTEEPDDSKILEEKLEKHPLEKDLNLVLAIPSVSSVSPLMTLLQYIHGPNVDVAATEKQGKTIVHAARFLPMNERMSTVLLATNESETIQRDPALNIFKAFGNLKRISVVPHLIVSAVTDYPKDVARLAYDEHSDMVIVPFQPGKPKATKQAAEKEDRGVMSLWFSNPEGTNHSSGANTEDSVESRVVDIVDQLLRKCRIKVAVLVDRGLQSQEITGTTNILVPFFGGPDDRESALFALRLGTHRKVLIHFMHISVLVAGSSTGNGSQQSIDHEDAKMIEFIKKLSQESKDSGPCQIKYTHIVDDNLYANVLNELKRIDYALVVVGHFGPHWTTLLQQEREETANLEQNSNTVWSMFKQTTVGSLTSQTKAETSILSRAPSVRQTLVESVLGPTGSIIYSEGSGKATLIVIRKLRIDKHLL